MFVPDFNVSDTGLSQLTAEITILALLADMQRGRTMGNSYEALHSESMALRIITGRGKHSASEPRLRAKVLEVLRDSGFSNATTTKRNPGLVVLRREDFLVGYSNRKATDAQPSTFL